MSVITLPPISPCAKITLGSLLLLIIFIKPFFIYKVFSTSGGSVVNKLLQYKTSLNFYVLQTVQYSKYFKQPNHKNDYYNCVENVFDGTLHGNIAVHQPKYHPNNQDDDNDC